MTRPYGTHSSLRRDRKAQTREKLLNAAAEVFGEQGIATGKVEDIAARSGVSRQTFYFHFESREQVLVEIMRRQESRMLDEYERLAGIAAPTPAESADWAASFLANAREDRTTILLLMRTAPFEASTSEHRSRYYDEVIALMAGRYPAFAAARAEADPLRHARALLLFFQLEAMLRYALVEADLDTASLCQAWGQQWSDFIRDCP